MDNRTDLEVRGNINASRYTDILMDHVMPIAIGMEPEFILQQNNAKVHTAKVTMAVLRQLHIQRMS